MKKVLVVCLCLLMVAVGSIVVIAANPITITVNGRVIQPDVPPQIIGGRTMVPLRAVAEALGANVEWDGNTNTVIITTGQSIPQPAPVQPSSPIGLSRTNPVPLGQSFLTPDGFEIKIIKKTEGSSAWNIIKEANMFNDPPADGYKYVIVTYTVKNVSSKEEPAWVSDSSFALIGSSNRVVNTFDKSVVLPSEGSYSGMSESLYHGGEATGSSNYYVPEGESGMQLIWNPLSSSGKIYFAAE